MQKHIVIFKGLLQREPFRYSQRQLAQWGNLTDSKVSRFLNNGCDLKAGEFFALLAAMPEPFRQQFWQRFQLDYRDEVDLKAFVLSADFDETTEILKLIANRWEQTKAPSQKAVIKPAMKPSIAATSVA